MAGLVGMHPTALAAGPSTDKQSVQSGMTDRATKTLANKPAVAAEAPVVKVENPWVRPTVKGQTASGGFMGLTASRDLTLIGFATPVAGETELHEMVMEGDVMRMRAVDALHLPSDQTVELKPGPGNKHLMLMDLKRQLKTGEALKLTLKLRDTDGKVFTQEIIVPVRASTASGAAVVPGGHQHDGR
jgi:copper(I)-binding protein